MTFSSQDVDGTFTRAALRVRALRPRAQAAFLGGNERLWNQLPPYVRDRRPVLAYGGWLHGLVARRAEREMYLGTYFLRNRPALELMAHLAERQEQGAAFSIAVLGCSIGVEVYSIVWTLRSARPDLEVTVQAVDISADAVDVGRRGIYDGELSEMVHSSIFRGLSDDERAQIFDWDGDRGSIKDRLREGISWTVGDASDPALVAALGQQDLVVANNFLCHLPPQVAEACLRNLAGLVRRDCHLFVSGVDLDVRTRVALDLGWTPVTDLLVEIHEGDPLVRRDWPWRWWGLEPLDRRRLDWQVRYSAVFRARPAGAGGAGAAASTSA